MNMKKECSKCKNVKQLNLFWKKGRNRDGYQTQCIECMTGKIPKIIKKEMEKTHRVCKNCCELKPLDDFYKRKYMKSNLRRNVCKKCELFKAKLNLHKKYKLTKEEYSKIYNKFDGKCYICKIKPRKPYIDHSHDTGRVRGILCPKCNTAIGMLNDDVNLLNEAIQYILVNNQNTSSYTSTKE